MVTIRGLDERDKENLAQFILEIYKEYPNAMWFEKEPDAETMSRLFSAKISGIEEKKVVDIVAIRTESDGKESIVGEAEIAKLAGHIGYVGIIISKEHREKGLGSRLLEHASENAVSLGITELRAEVAGENVTAQEFFKSRGFVLQEPENNQQKSGILLFRRVLE